MFLKHSDEGIAVLILLLLSPYQRFRYAVTTPLISHFASSIVFSFYCVDCLQHWFYCWDNDSNQKKFYYRKFNLSWRSFFIVYCNGDESPSTHGVALYMYRYMYDNHALDCMHITRIHVDRVLECCTSCHSIMY